MQTVLGRFGTNQYIKPIWMVQLCPMNRHQDRQLAILWIFFFKNILWILGYISNDSKQTKNYIVFQDLRIMLMIITILGAYFKKRRYIENMQFDYHRHKELWNFYFILFIYFKHQYGHDPLFIYKPN